MSISDYQKEVRIVERLDKVAPDLHVEYEFCGPNWFRRMGLQPKWLNRVKCVDVIGFRNGKTLTLDDVPFEFDDESFLAIRDDLLELKELTKLFMWYTKLTDEAIDDLEDFRNLEILQLSSCNNMTNLAAERLKSRLSNTEIYPPLGLNPVR